MRNLGALITQLNCFYKGVGAKPPLALPVCSPVCCIYTEYVPMSVCVTCWEYVQCILALRVYSVSQPNLLKYLRAVHTVRVR